MRKALNTVGRGIGVLCGALLAVGWAVVIWVPTAGLTLSGVTFVTALLFAMGALFATIASLRGHAVVVLLVFIASFFPVGFSLIGADFWLQWVGWLDLGLLAAAVLMWTTRRAA